MADMTTDTLPIIREQDRLGRVECTVKALCLVGEGLSDPFDRAAVCELATTALQRIKKVQRRLDAYRAGVAAPVSPQSIATAPVCPGKAFGPVLLFDRVNVDDWCIGFWKEGAWWGDGDARLEPTHWAPLPMRPKVLPVVDGQRMVYHEE